MGSKSKQPAARLGDIGSKHGKYPPTPIMSGSGDVKINGRPAARQGDSLVPHTAPKKSPHGRKIAEGSSSVLINGKPAARVTDAISCGGKVSNGSGDVLIGDSPELREAIPFKLNFSGKRQADNGLTYEAGRCTPDNPLGLDDVELAAVQLYYWQGTLGVPAPARISKANFSDAMLRHLDEQMPLERAEWLKSREGPQMVPVSDAEHRAMQEAKAAELRAAEESVWRDTFHYRAAYSLQDGLVLLGTETALAPIANRVAASLSNAYWALRGERAATNAALRAEMQTALGADLRTANPQAVSLVEGGRGGVSRAVVPSNEPALSRLSQSGALMATEGSQVFKFNGKLSNPTHPLFKHGPDVTDKFIYDRVANELVAKNRTGLRTAFNDRAQMESAISETFSLKQNEINAWIASNPKAGIPRAFEANPGMGNLGRGYEVTTKGGQIVPIDRSMPNVNLVLIPNGNGGFLIHTAHPF